MTETGEGIVNPEEIVIKSEDVPTTLEIAQQGAKEFQQVIEEVTSPRLRNLLLQHPKFKNCFLGIAPEIGIRGIDPLFQLQDEEWSEFGQAMEGAGSSLTPIFYDYEHPEGEVETCLAILNIPAATHVIINHSDYFPEEALSDPTAWLLASPEEWLFPDGSFTRDVRYGLLSGFPEWAVSKFGMYNNIFEALEDLQIPDEDIELIYGTLRESDEVSEEQIEQVKNKIKQYVPGVEPEALEVFLQHKVVSSKAGNPYLGFDAPKDAAFVTAINNIYDQSGIISVLDEINKSSDNFLKS